MGHHRADHRAVRGLPSATRAPAQPGRHTAVPSAVVRPHRARTRFLGAVPTLVGVAVLAVAGTGAVGTSPGSDLPRGVSAAVAAAPAASPSESQPVEGQEIVIDLEEREAAISRDSQRQALQDAADAELVEAAEEQAVERNATLKSLAKATEQRASQLRANQWTIPTSNYRLTARFGQSGGYWSSNHTGLDFAAPSGTPIVAVAAGQVTETGYEGSYGNKTVVTLSDGTEIWYCHQTTIDVQVGQQVGSGQQIGTVGSTGNSTGPHLHLEVRPGGGDPVDPYQALVVNGLTP